MSSNGNSNGSGWLDDQRIRVGFLPLLRQIYRQPRHLEQQPMMIVGARNVVPPADDGGLHLKSVGPGQPVRAVLLDDEEARAGDERIGQTAEGTDGVGVGQVLERPLEPNQIGAGAVQRTVSAAIFARTIPTGTGTGTGTSGNRPSKNSSRDSALDSASADLVWLQWTLQYLTDADAVRALRGLADALVAGTGFLVVKENRPYGLARTDRFQMETPVVSGRYDITRTDDHHRLLFEMAGLAVDLAEEGEETNTYALVVKPAAAVAVAVAAH
mmetsp:Transcript_7342/g.17456  ORF Transcript_7342/g.17456 Transcript_7342/m.17456 type:complete len:271 (-) Transcript_7342:123-935(-)